MMIALIHEHFDVFIWSMFDLVMLGFLMRELLLRRGSESHRTQNESLEINMQDVLMNSKPLVLIVPVGAEPSVASALGKLNAALMRGE